MYIFFLIQIQGDFMKIYRLEEAGVGKGPFTCSISFPYKWADTHFAPHDERNISHHAYEK